MGVGTANVDNIGEQKSYKQYLHSFISTTNTRTTNNSNRTNVNGSVDCNGGR